MNVNTDTADEFYPPGANSDALPLIDHGFGEFEPDLQLGLRASNHLGLGPGRAVSAFPWPSGTLGVRPHGLGPQSTSAYPVSYSDVSWCETGLAQQV